jgi:hypothetical protein
VESREGIVMDRGSDCDTSEIDVQKISGKEVTKSEDASMKVIGNEGTFIGASKVNDASQ